MQRRTNEGPPPFKFNVSFLEEKNLCDEMRRVWKAASSAYNTSPQDRWNARIKAIVDLAKKKGKEKARRRREGLKGLAYAIQCTRHSAATNPHDLNALNFLNNLEVAAKNFENMRAESARVQSQDCIG